MDKRDLIKFINSRLFLKKFRIQIENNTNSSQTKNYFQFQQFKRNNS